MNYKMIERLTCVNQKPLWNINASRHERIQSIEKAYKELKAEHSAACDDEDISDIDCGVLLGVLNLVEGLLKGVEK